jgi:hypothetical protein
MTLNPAARYWDQDPHARDALRVPEGTTASRHHLQWPRSTL